jgi:D-3-phosphoglycerate dehydrogenase / 2-oxoglutarate reductase
MRVLITDPLSPVALEMLAEAGLETSVQTGLSPDELREAASGAHAWLVRSGTQITADLIAAATDLRVIGRAGVGVDNVDLEAATRRGILVLNAPDGNTLSTAEHTCAMMLALARQIPAAHASTRDGGWERKRFDGAELAGKTLGVIGVGKIGRAVAERMRASGCGWSGSTRCSLRKPRSASA